MAQTLQTIISLSGRVDNSFGAIGDALLNVGNHIDAISQKIIDFGKESVEEYVDYDDVMREVQALGEYDDKTMRILDEYNRTIAQSSKYTMEQAAQAEVMMAQLGLNMDQTKTLMPTVMNLASAANIDLADSLDYLYYSLNALDLPMEYANTLSDQMAKTAAISAADIDTLGMSLQRLGSGAQFFAGGSSEILAILGGISQFGQDMQGSNAGTQLRNFMLTLLAPTGSKATLMESLGVTETEWADFESYMEDAGISVTDTADAMNELGLTVYDSTTGKLKPAIQIIGELNAALSSMPEADQNEILGKLFGKRTTTTALNLLASLSTIIDYQKQIEGGSAGYTEAMADTMEGGLGGTLRQFTAAWEAFKVTIGENIAPEVGAVAGWMTDITNALTNMDDTALSALTGAAEGIAVAGPGLIVAAGAFKLIGFALTPVGQWAIGITLAAAAIGALTKGITEWQEAAFESNFGDMELDNTALMAHVNAIGDAFNSTYEHVNSYNDALNTAVENYTTASTTLSGDLLTNMITGATLTETQKKDIQNLGSTMGAELINGINAGFDSNASYLMMLGGEDWAEDPVYQDMILLNADVYAALIGEANQLGSELGSAIGSAIDDGIITGDEYNIIMEKMQAYNKAMAVMADAQNAGDFAMQLHKAQSVSWDSASAFLDEQAALMADNIAAAEEEHIRQKANQQFVYDYAVENGLVDPTKGEADLKAALAKMDADYEAKEQGYRDQNAETTLATFDALMSQSGYGEAWQFLSRLYSGGDLKRDEYGEVAWDAVDWAALFPEGMPIYGEDNPLADQLYDLWRGEHGLSGIGNALTEILGPYMDSESIALIPQMIDDALTIMGYTYRHDADTARETVDMNRGGLNEFFEVIGRGIENGSFGEYGAKWNSIGADSQDYVNQIVSGLKSAYDFESILADMGGVVASESNPYRDAAAAWQLMYGDINPEDYVITAQVDPVIDPSAIADQLDGVTMPVAIEPMQEGDPLAQLEEQGVEVSVDGDTTSLVATIEAEDGQTLLEYVNGDASALNMAIYAEDGKTLLEYVTGDTSQLAAAINSYNGRTITVNIRTNTIGGFRGFAEGGRATEASIFGEAGPEWAIPEEHTERTARLFDMAREASGFTWPELIARNGGLNAGGTMPTQIIYSPTIIANDATGVEDKLIEDKERLDNWWKEKQMRDDVEVYA